MKKSELLNLLREGGYLSGAELGKRFGVSRAAVSKAMAGLKKEGYAITSTPNKGYLLTGETRRISASGIRAALGDHPWAANLHVLAMVDSTNNYLKNAAAAGAAHGTVAVADWQTGGRGRMGRRFDSPPGTGVYLSAQVAGMIKKVVDKDKS